MTYKIRAYAIFGIFLIMSSCNGKPKEVPMGMPDDGNTKKEPNVQMDMVADTSIFNEPPVDIKTLVAYDGDYDVTSGILDAKYIDDFCPYKEYHLQRHYRIMPKYGNGSKTDLKVYVEDDEHKMSRADANEIFGAIDIKTETISAWNMFYISMPMDSLFDSIEGWPYKKDSLAVEVYSNNYISRFYFKDTKVNRIVIRRRCDD
jgi:hypothetical protein